MSDNPNLANTDTEPSMEDILSSIRKVIAEDLSRQDEVQTDEPQASAAQETPPNPLEDEIFKPSSQDGEAKVSTAFDNNPSEPASDLDILELNDLLEGDEAGDEEMEIIQLDDLNLSDEMEIPTPPESPEVLSENLSDHIGESEAISEAEPLQTSISDIVPVTETHDETQGELNAEAQSETGSARIDFDETLDLVMDADASDYIQTEITPITADVPAQDAPTSAEITPIPEQPQEPKTISNQDETELLDDILFENIEAESLEPENPEPENLDADYTDETLDEEVSEEISDTDLQDDLSANERDEDMDLVRSLLDDLMDEPVSEAVASEDLEADFTPDQDSGNLSIEVEDDSLAEEMMIPDPEAQDNHLSDDSVSDDEPESELARLAREITETSAPSAPETPEMDTADIVSLETPDLSSKLALTAGMAGVGIAATMASAPNAEPEANLAEEDTQPAKSRTSDLEELSQLMAEGPDAGKAGQASENTQETPTSTIQAETPTPQEKTNTQEENEMAASLKEEALSARETQQEASSAFASLTTAVQEKNLAEENGPPIGELVKEALKPMLQEWLDKNLKTMVQRAVNAEIKRISSGK